MEPENNRIETPSKIWGLLAEFETPGKLIEACSEVRERGYSNWDAHCPFPVHGLQTAMGLRPSRVPLFVLVLALSGAVIGMLMQWWVSTQGYALVISGKPLFSWPAFIPITFECAILGGATGAIFGFLFLARLPQPHHELFESERFERVTDDAFFISIEASDPGFDREKTQALLEGLGATHVESITG